MKTFLSIIFSMLVCLVFSQSDSLKYYKVKETGINLNGLVSQFISVGNTEDVMISKTIVWKRFANYRKLGTRYGFGINISTENDLVNIFHLSFGIEKRTKLGKKWTYYVGGDIIINVNDFSNDDPFGNGFGPALIIGGIYHITPNISISTETSLLLNIIPNESTFISFEPPFALYLNFSRIKKKSFKYLPKNN